MKLTLNVTNSTNAKQMEGFKTLMALLAKTQVFQKAPVRVVHHYAQQEWSDFMFEPLACGQQGYMRGRGSNIQRGDHVVLQSSAHVTYYRVDEIDYHTEPSDLWVALLHPCSERVVDRRFWMQPANASCRALG